MINDIGPDDVNALGIIVACLVSLTLTISFRQKPTRKWWLSLLGAVGLGFLFLLVALFGIHGCGAGTPVAQWALPAICAIALWLFSRPLWLRIAGPVALLVVAVVLSFHHGGLVHRADFTGNPAWDRQLVEGEIRGARMGIEHQLAEAFAAPGADRPPAGWLRESAAAGHLPEPLMTEAVRAANREVAFAALWHTWLTGVSAVLPEAPDPPRDFWYTGGACSSESPCLELRPRP